MPTNRANTALMLTLAGVAAAAPASFAGAAIIYNSQAATSPGGVYFINEVDETSSAMEQPGSATEREFDIRAGDSITFAGTDRFVTSFAVRLWSFTTPASPISTDVELTIYSSVAGLPGSVLWSGTVGGVAIGGTTAIPVVFAPNLTLPNSVCFAVALNNISATRMFGPSGASFATVGSSPSTVLRQSTSTLAWRTEVVPGGLQQMEARVEAVPAPAAVVVFACAGFAGPGRRRRR